MSPRVERWLARVRKQLPGPMYDHPQKAREPWDEKRVAKSLFEWSHRVATRDIEATIAASNAAFAQWKAKQ